VMLGVDHDIYMDATKRWLAGGSFYPEPQLAGPFAVRLGAVLYPPQMLVLFVPFCFLPGIVWVVVPTAITLAVVAAHRPALWAWTVIAGLLAAFPYSFLVYVSGTPTIWIVAFAALGTLWGAAYALVWCKPTLLPFALLGLRERRWWLLSAAVAVTGVLMLPLTLDWATTVVNSRGAGLLYSLENVPVLAIPIVAWLGRSHR
jgi:hypothetical protein